MIKSGVIKNGSALILDDNDICEYFKDKIESSDSQKKALYKKAVTFLIGKNYPFLLPIEFFVAFEGYVVVHNKTVYYREDESSIGLDKVEYAKCGYSLQPRKQIVYTGDKFQYVRDEIEEIVSRRSKMASYSDENELRYWFPRVRDAGFYVPKTSITGLREDEVDYAKSCEFNRIDRIKLLQRIREDLIRNGLTPESEMFLRLGICSNRFNFDACRVQGLEELPLKLRKNFIELRHQLEWRSRIDIVLREFIKTSEETTIYKGLPLNLEFRVFYDFDKGRIMGVFNYWDSDTMLPLLSGKDSVTLANKVEDLEEKATELKPQLIEEISSILPKVPINGDWALDFMYDGKRFVLIDMARAECSLYYDQVLRHRPIK